MFAWAALVNGPLWLNGASAPSCLLIRVLLHGSSHFATSSGFGMGLTSNRYPLVNRPHNYGKSHSLMGKLTISMAIFHSHAEKKKWFRSSLYSSYVPGNPTHPLMHQAQDKICVWNLNSEQSQNSIRKQKNSESCICHISFYQLQGPKFI